jgi:hypothetical protein
MSAICSPVKRILPGFLEGTKGNTTRRCRVATRITGDFRGTTVTAAPSGNRVPRCNTTTPFRTRPGIVFMRSLSIFPTGESRLVDRLISPQQLLDLVPFGQFVDDGWQVAGTADGGQHVLQTVA